MTKRSSRSFFRDTIKPAALGFGLMALGLIIGLVGVAVGGLADTAILIIGITIAAIGGFLAGGSI